MGPILVTILEILYWAFFVLLLARIIFSWVQVGSYRLRALVFRITDPILNPIRRILPGMGGMDFSPVIVLVIAQIVKTILQRLVAGL